MYYYCGSIDGYSALGNFSFTGNLHYMYQSLKKKNYFYSHNFHELFDQVYKTTNQVF